MHRSFATPLAPLTTLRVGGPARELVRGESEGEIAEAVREIDGRGAPLLVLGGGSNVVIADRGWDGVVLHVASRGVSVTAEAGGARFRVAGGESWDAFVARAVAEGFCGVECLAGIPGTVGAVPVQNVGAYGQEVSQCITRVRAYDRQTARLVDLPGKACGFAYRHSVFKTSERYVIVEVELVLARSRESGPIVYPELAAALGLGDGGRAARNTPPNAPPNAPPIARVREAVLALRAAKGMVIDPGDAESVSVGSFFVNPILSGDAYAALAERAAARGLGAPPRFSAEGGAIKTSAAWLVERSGFSKGFTQGNAGVSRKHALALVNRGGASAAEIIALARAIRAAVARDFGVTLAVEPRVVGDVV